jgi:hypothetical protein
MAKCIISIVYIETCNTTKKDEIYPPMELLHVGADGISKNLFGVVQQILRA